MTFAHPEALTDVVLLRGPARSNHFTILAKARFGDKQVLLQQPHLGLGSRTAARDYDTWLQVLAHDPNACRESHLVSVLGTLPLPLPPSVALNPAPGSVFSTYATDRPVYVVDHYERGSLRSCLDRGEFSHSNPARSDWSAKLVVMKDIAKALHYIKCNLMGQQHGALSSDAVFIDKDGHAFLSWHDWNRTRQDLESGKCQDWRWLTPDSVRQLRDSLVQDSDDSTEFLGHEIDDVYSFGVLAWEIATEELPFDKLHLFSGQRLLQSIERRFLKTPPQSLMQIIQQCQADNIEERPSWCTILSQLDTLDPRNLEVEWETNSNENPPSAPTCTPSSPLSLGLDDSKSKVVEMMESILALTFYKKVLPPNLISVTSNAGRSLFREMIQARTGESFFTLFTSFSTQSDPAFCGVSSLSMVLNALEIDPRRQWKGVWRWYSEEQLDCCASVAEMRKKGITFNQFSCLAKCHASVVAKSADRHSVDEFRRDIMSVTSSEGSHMVISFSRAALGQTGSGHFSPIGGYHAEKDMVLVLDSARFKYPPFFAAVQELWESLQPVDPETGKCRGYFLITANEQQKLDIQKRRLEAAMEKNGAVMPSPHATSATPSSVQLLETNQTVQASLPVSILEPALQADSNIQAGDAIPKEKISTGCDCNCG